MMQNQENFSKYNISLVYIAITMFCAAILVITSYLTFTVDIAVALERISGFALMFLAIIIIVKSCGYRWSGSLGILHIGMLILYHGLTEFLYILFPQGSRQRLLAGVTDNMSADATLIAGFGMFVFSIGYLIIYVLENKRTTKSPMSNDWTRSVDLNIITVWLIIDIIYQAGADTYFENYWTSALFDYLFLPVLVLFVLKITQAWRYGKITPYMLTFVLLVLSIALVILGNNRQNIVVASAVIVVLLHKWDIYKINKKIIFTVLILIFILSVMLASFRAIVGRESIISGDPIQRLELSMQIFSDIFRGSGWDIAKEGIFTDIGYRVDGNNLLGAMSTRVPFFEAHSFDTNPYQVALSSVIPSSIWNGKLDRPLEVRGVKGYFIMSLNLIPLDYNVTPLAVFYGCGGGIALTVLMALFGAAIAYMDKKLSSPNMQGGLFCVCIAVSLAWVERDITVILLSARNAIILMLFFALFGLVNKIITRKY